MAATKRTAATTAGKRTTGGGEPRAVDAGRLQRGIREVITSGEIISVGVVNLVRNTLVTALAGVQDVGRELGSAAVTAVRGSIRAADEIGADLGVVAKHAIKGTLQAAAEIGGELGGVARSATRGVVKATGEVGGDVGKVARKAVEGTAEAARELGVDVRDLARSAARGAVEAADRIGSAAGRSVRTTLSGTAEGVRTLIGNATRRPSAKAAGRPRGARRRTKPESVTDESVEPVNQRKSRRKSA
jgi:hypothetical protein